MRRHRQGQRQLACMYVSRREAAAGTSFRRRARASSTFAVALSCSRIASLACVRCRPAMCGRRGCTAAACHASGHGRRRAATWQAGVAQPCEGLLSSRSRRSRSASTAATSTRRPARACAARHGLHSKHRGALVSGSKCAACHSLLPCCSTVAHLCMPWCTCQTCRMGTCADSLHAASTCTTQAHRSSARALAAAFVGRPR
jgi:hypothetical protein